MERRDCERVRAEPGRREGQLQCPDLCQGGTGPGRGTGTTQESTDVGQFRRPRGKALRLL